MGREQCVEVLGYVRTMADRSVGRSGRIPCPMSDFRFDSRDPRTRRVWVALHGVDY